MVSKLNGSDYQLMELLDRDAKSSLKHLSSKLHISKPACGSKISRLQNKGIIEFISIVDYFLIGRNNVHIYLKLRGVKKEWYDSSVELLKNSENVVWIAEFFGDYDLGISIFYSTPYELKSTINQVYDLLGKYVIEDTKEFIMSQVVQGFCHNDDVMNRTIVPMSVQKDVLVLSNLEKKIVDLITLNARYTYREIGLALNKKPETIKKHILNLETKGVIKKYKLLIDFNKMGYIWSLCKLSIAKGTDIKKIIGEFALERRIPFISATLGNSIIIDFISQNYSELKSFLEEIKIRFNNITDFKVLNIDKIIKLE